LFYILPTLNTPLHILNCHIKYVKLYSYFGFKKDSAKVIEEFVYNILQIEKYDEEN